MFCNSCGEKNADTAKFCNACGAVITITDELPVVSPSLNEQEENYFFDIELIDVGTDKLKVIKLLRDKLSIGLKESKDLVDGAPVVLKLGAYEVEAERFRLSLQEAGARAVLIKGEQLVRADAPKIIPQIAKKNTVVISDKNELLTKLRSVRKVLAEADKRQFGVQNSVESVQRVFNELNTARTRLEELDKAAERQAEKFIGFDWIMIAIYTIIGSVVPVIGNIVMFIVGFILQAALVCKFTFRKRRASMPDKYRRKHEAEFNAAAADVERTVHEHAEWTKVMSEKSESLQSFLYSEEYQDIGTFLTDKYISFGIVNWMIEALESQRADSLKEVINLYEDELHKGRLEAMQKQQIAMQADQLAVTVKQLATAQETADYARRTADESEKATAFAEQTAKNTKKTAKSARYGNVVNTVNTVRHWNDGKKK